jgi:Helix-turn-helix domain
LSIKVISQVFELAVTATEKIVLLALADHAHDDGTRAYPSVALLTRKTSLSRRGVQTVLRRLERKGLIMPTEHLAGGRKGTTEYRFTLTPIKCVAGAPFSLPMRRTPSTKRAHGATEKGESGAPESSLISHNPITGQAVGDPSIGDSKLGESNRHHQNVVTQDDDKTSLPIKARKADQFDDVSARQMWDRSYSDRVDVFRENVLPEFIALGYERQFLNLALDVIDQRAWDSGARISSAAYLSTALKNLLCDVRTVDRIKRMRAEGRLSPADIVLVVPILSVESEAARVQFNSQLNPEKGHTMSETVREQNGEHVKSPEELTQD